MQMTTKSRYSLGDKIPTPVHRIHKQPRVEEDNRAELADKPPSSQDAHGVFDFRIRHAHGWFKEIKAQFGPYLR